MTEKRVIKLKTPDSEWPLQEGQVIIHPLNRLRRAIMEKLKSSRVSDDDSESAGEENTEKVAGEQ